MNGYITLDDAKRREGTGKRVKEAIRFGCRLQSTDLLTPVDKVADSSQQTC
ncbi:MAG: hypothetical protein IJ633_06965 [Prevotella sp.]|nr:hypothetical protein [Prevotella sp.]